MSNFFSWNQFHEKKRTLFLVYNQFQEIFLVLLITYQDDVLDRLDLLDPLAVFPLDSCNFETDVVTGLFLALSIDVGWDVLDQSLHNCCWEYTKIQWDYYYTPLLYIHSVSKLQENIFNWKKICSIPHKIFLFC